MGCAGTLQGSSKFFKKFKKKETKSVLFPLNSKAGECHCFRMQHSPTAFPPCIPAQPCMRGDCISPLLLLRCPSPAGDGGSSRPQTCTTSLCFRLLRCREEQNWGFFPKRGSFLPSDGKACLAAPCLLPARTSPGGHSQDQAGSWKGQRPEQPKPGWLGSWRQRGWVVSWSPTGKSSLLPVPTPFSMQKLQTHTAASQTPPCNYRSTVSSGLPLI